MDVGSSSGASSSDVLASGNGAATAEGAFCFCAGGFGDFGLQISATSAGRSSGGARATDAISAAVGLTSPESTFCRVPGTASSAASTPLENCSARSTVFLLMPFSVAIFLQVIRLPPKFPFWGFGLNVPFAPRLFPWSPPSFIFSASYGACPLPSFGGAPRYELSGEAAMNIFVTYLK